MSYSIFRYRSQLSNVLKRNAQSTKTRSLECVQNGKNVRNVFNRRNRSANNTHSSSAHQLFPNLAVALWLKRSGMC